MTYQRFSDIPQFTSWGGYAVDVGWAYLEEHLASMERGMIMDMDPDFQRAHVWTYAQQIRYVEFKLRGGRTGTDILWNCPSWQGGSMKEEFDRTILLVDGKQRLQAARRFMNGEIPAFDQLRGSYRDELPWMGVSFKFHVNSLRTRAEVLQWYLDLNTGGTVHTDDEIDKVRQLLANESEG